MVYLTGRREDREQDKKTRDFTNNIRNKRTLEIASEEHIEPRIVEGSAEMKGEGGGSDHGDATPTTRSPCACAARARASSWVAITRSRLVIAFQSKAVAR